MARFPTVEADPVADPKVATEKARAEAAEAVAKAVADAALPKAGGTMLGKIVLDGDPTLNLHPATKQYVTAQITALVAGAPGALDTLKEISEALEEGDDAVAALTTVVSGKLGKSSNLSDVADAVAARGNIGAASAAALTSETAAREAADAAIPGSLVNTTGFTPGAPKSFLFTPMGTGEAWRVGGVDGAGIQSGQGKTADVYSSSTMRLLGRRSSTTPPTPASVATTDPHVLVQGTQTNRPLVSLLPAAGATSDTLEIYNASGTKISRIDSAGRIGLDGATPGTAMLRIGQGTGTLADRGELGIKVKLDGSRDGIQSNINIVKETGGTSSVRAILGYLEVNDTSGAGAGDAVALWGSTINNVAHGRSTWGLNTFVSIREGATGYAAAAVGAEIGAFHSTATDNPGGGLHIAMSGTSTGRFAFALLHNATSVVRDVMLFDGVPDENFLWIQDGSLGGGNTKSGTPLVQLDKLGRLGLGITPTVKLDVQGDTRVRGVLRAKSDLLKSGERFKPTGAISTTFDRRTSSSTANSLLASGVPQLAALYLNEGDFVSSVTFVSGATGTGVTNRVFALTDANRNVLRLSADDGANSWGASSPRTLALSSSYTATADGIYYVVIWEKATTPTQLRVGTISSVLAAIEPVLTGASSTTGLTNPASCPSTLGATSSAGAIPYAWVS